MTIAQWFDENRIENLPILNICVCRGMKKEDYENHLFLQDSVFEIEFVNAQGLPDKKQFEIPGYKNIREILIGLTGLFSDFCHESSMITNLRYAGKIPRKYLSVNKRISNALGKLYATPEELAAFTAYWQAEGKVFHHVQWQQKFARSLQINRASNGGQPKRDINAFSEPDKQIPNGFRGAK